MFVLYLEVMDADCEDETREFHLWIAPNECVFGPLACNECILMVPIFVMPEE
jgi:hypothetical protein